MKYLWHRDTEYILYYTANQWQGEGSNQSNLHAPRAQALDHSAACPHFHNPCPRKDKVIRQKPGWAVDKLKKSGQ